MSTSCFVVALLLVVAATASAREVRFPLTVPPPVVREAIVKQIFNQPGERAVFWGAPGDCSFFYLEKPVVEVGEGAIQVVSHGKADLGTEYFGGCLSPLSWSGFVEVFEEPVIRGWSLRFRVANSNVYDENRQKALLTGVLWDRIKDAVTPQFGSVVVDLGSPFAELKEFLPLVVNADQMERIQPVLASLRPVSAAATPAGLTVEAAFQVPDPVLPVAGAEPEPPLTPEELEAFNARLNRWDAFVTFVVKELGQMTLSKPTRDALLETLLAARYDIVKALERPARSEDPVRRLFVESWERLRPVADDLAREVPGGESFRLLVFIAAGDALRALDQAGPALGIDISADGLRRLARMIEPGYVGDPLEYSPAVDPSVQRLFGLGEIQETELGPGSWLRWLSPRSAWAADAEWRRWTVPVRDEADDYLRRVGRLLDETAARVADTKNVGEIESEFYKRLLPAAAWQESCWRQFVRQGDEMTYLRSPRSSVGILQVNERVWRGFYDRERLRWDIAYNARSGAEILHQYQEMVEGKGLALRTTTMDPVARAVYSAYNGGPSQLGRYLDPKRRSRRISKVMDKLFGPKFAATASGTDGLFDKVGVCLFGETRT